MRLWMMAGGAAVLIAGGSARAVERVDGAAPVDLAFADVPAAHASDVSADGIPPSYTVLMRKEPLDFPHRMGEDGKGCVTREDFLKFQESVFARIDGNGEGKVVGTEFGDGGLAGRGDGGG